MSKQLVTRRIFVRDTAVMAAGVAAGVSVAVTPRRIVAAGATDVPAEVKGTRNYQTNMEYRRLGKTGLWVSAVCLGGHWKRVDKMIQLQGTMDPYRGSANSADMQALRKNRDEVISRCIEVGINCIVWRLMAYERGGSHSSAEVEAMIEALEIARRKGLCRFTGCSTHDRKWARMLIETYPDVIQMVCMPYTADSKVLPQDSLFESLIKHDVGLLGIKPFASNSIFHGDGSPNGPHVEEDDRRARMAIRYILGNPAITAPIPGLISAHHVDNVVQAVQEHRELDVEERAELRRMGAQMWANLPPDYQWLKQWEYV
jgi:aryl-alcohol dehydrogenase-like predicted oxidoreductase